MSAAVPAPETARKRLAMRSWRRGMREVDLLVGPFADAALAGMSNAELDAFAALLDENDHDIYGWILSVDSSESGVPDQHAELIARIAAAAHARVGRI